MQFPTFQMYKQAKDIFRTSLNKAYLDYERETYSSLDVISTISRYGPNSGAKRKLIPLL